MNPPAFTGTTLVRDGGSDRYLVILHAPADARPALFLSTLTTNSR